MTTIEGVEIDIGPEAVIVTSATPLTVLSSAIAGGGLGRARVIMNLHVEKDSPFSLSNLLKRHKYMTAERQVKTPEDLHRDRNEG